MPLPLGWLVDKVLRMILRGLPGGWEIKKELKCVSKVCIWPSELYLYNDHGDFESHVTMRGGWKLVFQLDFSLKLPKRLVSFQKLKNRHLVCPS